MKICQACSHELTVGRSVGRKDVCSFCKADIRCCLNCGFFDRAASKQCREPVAEIVKEKTRANFCDFFAVRDSNGPDGPVAGSEQARRALDELFKK